MKILFNKGLAYLSYKLKLERSLAKPLLFFLEPTNACMMTCKMCPRRNMTRAVGFMDMDLFKKIVDQLKYNNNLILHHFGDPLIHPKISEMISYLKEKNIHSGMSVNPKLLNEKMCNNLIDAGLGYVTIALDGVNEETYRYFRGDNANYNEAINNIKTLLEIKKSKESDLKIIIQMILMKHNKNQVEEFKRIWNINGIDEVSIKQFVTFDGSDLDIIKEGDKDTYSNKFKGKVKDLCSWPWSAIGVMWDGRVVTCCGDFDGRYILGDLNKESLKDIWNGDKIRWLRKSLCSGNLKDNILCRNCKDIRTEIIFKRFLKYIKNQFTVEEYKNGK